MCGQCGRRAVKDFGLVKAVCSLWNCLWASGGLRWKVNILLEMGVLKALDGTVMGVVRSLPSGLAYGPLRILNEHFRL